MMYAIALIALGISIQMYEITNPSMDSILSSIIGGIFYIVGAIIAMNIESKLNDKIKELEEEIKEMKSK